MMADGWLGESERVGEVADAGLAGWLGLDQAQDSQPSGVGQDPQDRRQLRGGLIVERCA